MDFSEDEQLQDYEDEEEESDSEEDDIESSTVAQNAAGIAGEGESRDGAEEGGGKRRRTGGPDTSSFSGIGSAERSQGSEWNRNQMDGLFCPICLDAWTGDGDHHIRNCNCLPCGHIFGLSCIKKWLQRKNWGKCPQCNTKCKLKDVRKLYASRVVSVDEESEKRFRSLEAECGSLKKKVAGLCEKEAQMQLTVQELSEQLMPSATSLQSIEDKLDVVSEKMSKLHAELLSKLGGLDSTLEQLKQPS